MNIPNSMIGGIGLLTFPSLLGLWLFQQSLRQAPSDMPVFEPWYAPLFDFSHLTVYSEPALTYMLVVLVAFFYLGAFSLVWALAVALLDRMDCAATSSTGRDSP